MSVVMFSNTVDFINLIHEAFDEINESGIDLSQHVSEEVLAGMCDLEKTVSINRLRIYLVMKRLGSDIRMPEFFAVFRPWFRRLCVTKNSSDSSWKSDSKARNAKHLRSLKKKFKRGDAVAGKNLECSELERPLSSGAEQKLNDIFRRFEARRFLHRLENEIGFKLFLKKKMKKKLKDLFFFETLDASGDKYMAKVREAIQENIRNEGRSTFPKSNIDKIEYYESDETSDDEYLLCDQCNKKYFHGSCPVHGFPHFVKDSHVNVENRVAMQLKGPDTHAAWTTPDCLEVALSNILGVGYGVFTRQTFSKGTMFGPYQGSRIHSELIAHRSSYAWEIYNNGKVDHYVDGKDPSMSNWMRYVNCSLSESTQNVKAIQFCGQIYYRACIEIAMGVEMITWYGIEYVEELGLLKVHSRTSEEYPLLCKEDHNVYFANPIQGDQFNSDAEKKSQMYHPTEMKSSPIFDHSYSVNRFPIFSEDKSRLSNNKQQGDGKQRPYHCSQCPKSYALLQSLRIHMRIHTGENLYECSVCSLKFTRHSHINAHMRIHTGEKPYECSVCGVRFTDIGQRNRHWRIHTGEKPYECSVCGVRFARMSYRNDHIRIHTGEKPYECFVCGMRFTWRGQRIHHLKIHTAEKPYESSVCGVRFA